MDKTSILTALAAFLAVDSLPGSVEVEDRGGGEFRVTGLPHSQATRFRLPVEMRRTPAAASAPESSADAAEVSGDAPPATRSALQARAEEAAEEGNTETIGVILGIASSTSQDYYGTDMHLSALESMQEQFRASPGVPLLPTHFIGWSLPEWDDVIGASVDAEIRKQDVEKPVNGEPGYVLEVASALYNVPKAVELRDRIDIGQPIGQSIGGWFTELSFHYNEETDELERVQVHAVELDHLAVTRMPANPDSMGLTNLRSRLNASMPRRIKRAQPPVLGNRPSVSARDIPGGTLDMPGDAGEDAVAAPEARAPLASNTDPGETMTHDQIAEIVQRSIEESMKAALPDAVRTAVDAAVQAHVAPLREELTALAAKVTGIETRAATPAPAPVAVLNADSSTDNTELAQLRARVAEQEKLIVRLAETPDRRAVRHVDNVPQFTSGQGAEHAFRSIAAQAKTDQVGAALAVVVEKHASLIAEEDGPAKVTGSGSVRNLRRVLCAGLRAAEADGLIAKPVLGWS